MKPFFHDKLLVWEVGGSVYGLSIYEEKIYYEVNDVQGRKYWQEINVDHNDIFEPLLYIAKDALSEGMWRHGGGC